MTSKSRPSQTVRAVSKIELARYLKSLADIQSDPKLGNAALAQALNNLSISLQGRPQSKPKLLEPERDQFKNLTPKQTKNYITNNLTAKSTLIDIARERFSIAPSRLNRMPRKEIVETIIDALEHEQSLEIIATEAQKGAKTRTS